MYPHGRLADSESVCDVTGTQVRESYKRHDLALPLRKPSQLIDFDIGLVADWLGRPHLVGQQVQTALHPPSAVHFAERKPHSDQVDPRLRRL
jgi:hypothetical protein